MKLRKSLHLLLASVSLIGQSVFGQVWNPGHSVGTSDGKYNFAYNQMPSQLVEINPAAVPNTGLTYQWESSITPASGFTSISGATASSYSIPAPLSQSTYYRRKTTYPSNGNYIYSNTIKISVVFVNWEDLNYVREHDMLTINVLDWQNADQLEIGSKLQTT